MQIVSRQRRKLRLITWILYSDVLDLVASVEQVHYAGAIRYVEVSEVVQVIIRIEDQGMGVIGPQID